MVWDLGISSTAPNLKYPPGFYTDIPKLGGKNADSIITTTKANNAFYGFKVRDIGVANINRYGGNKYQARIGEIANARDYGGGRGGTVAGKAGMGLQLAVIPDKEERKEPHLEAAARNLKEIIGMVITTQILKNGGIERVKKILVAKILTVSKKQKRLTKLGWS